MEKKPYERPTLNKLQPNIPGKFGIRKEINPVTSIDGVPVSELAGNYGSPLFVLSEKSIVRTLASARRAFTTRYPKVQFAWSYKTNYLDAVCRIYHREGSWAEVVSEFEFDKAILNGVDGRNIIYNGPDKSEESLRKAIRHDALIHIDHLDELYLLNEISAGTSTRPRVAIRINMDTGIYPQWDRFGFNLENGQAWDAISKILNSGRLNLVGLHTHIGTFILSAGAYGTAAAKLAALAVDMQRRKNHTIKYIDLGGGFASGNNLKGSYLPGTDINPGFDEYAEAITSALHNSEFESDKLPILILETGRALVDDAGCLVSTVLGNKRLVNGHKATIIDAGVNVLFTSFWYDHRVAPAQPVASSHNEDTTLYGPLCMNIDVIRENISLPPLRRGDRIVIQQTGAYNMTQWMQFITMRPAVVLIDQGGKTHLVRKREDLDMISAAEVIPDYLKK